MSLDFIFNLKKFGSKVFDQTFPVQDLGTCLSPNPTEDSLEALWPRLKVVKTKDSNMNIFTTFQIFTLFLNYFGENEYLI